MRRATQVCAGALAAVCTLALPTAAAADPAGAKSAQVFDLACDDGTTTEIVVNGAGNWTPGHEVGTNAIFVPVWFGEVTGTVTDTEGNVLYSFTDPPMSKGPAKNADLLCTFSGSFTFPDADLGIITVSLVGEVAGFHTPRN